MNDIAHKIMRLREKNGLTQESFAEKCGLSRSTIARYEAGSITPSFSTLQKMATAYSISTDYFFRNENNSNSKSTREAEAKFVVFGDPNATDAQLEEVKQFARFIRERDKK